MASQVLQLCIATFIGQSSGPSGFEQLSRLKERLPSGPYQFTTGESFSIEYARQLPLVNFSFADDTFPIVAPRQKSNRWVAGPEFRTVFTDEVVALSASDDHGDHVRGTQAVFRFQDGRLRHLYFRAVLDFYDRRIPKRSLEYEGYVEL